MRVVCRNSHSKPSRRIISARNGRFDFDHRVKSQFPGHTNDEEARPGSESHFESLPLELLVNIVCSLRHDELKPVAQVSRHFRRAVEIAWRWHFNFQTPGRKRHRQLECSSPIRESSLFLSGAGADTLCPFDEKLVAPNAPKQLPKAMLAQLSVDQMRPLVTVLFQDLENRQSRKRETNSCKAEPAAWNSYCTFCDEEELCEAVALNSL